MVPTVRRRSPRTCPEAARVTNHRRDSLRRPVRGAAGGQWSELTWALSFTSVSGGRSGGRYGRPGRRTRHHLGVGHRKRPAGVNPRGRRFHYAGAVHLLLRGPQHVELVQGAPGSPWDGTDMPGVHHRGVWVDDVAAETARLVAAGWTVEMAQLPPHEGYGAITYVRSPSGFRLEPVTSAIQPLLERWWAGGPFA
jgi:hypothetical protein